MEINIRLATIEDVPALRALIRDSVSSLGAEHYTSQQIASSLFYVFGVDTQLIVDQTYFIAEVQGQMAGSGGWSKRVTLFGGDQAKGGSSDPLLVASHPESTEPLLDPAKDAARIRAFYVHPTWSRQGIASLILRSCEEAARKEGFATVELAGTLPGVPFYLARGYTKAEEILIQMEDGESLLTFRMTKSL